MPNGLVKPRHLEAGRLVRFSSQVTVGLLQAKQLNVIDQESREFCNMQVLQGIICLRMNYAWSQ